MKNIWSSKNIPIAKGWEQIGNPGVIVSDTPHDRLYREVDRIHEDYILAFKETNKDEKKIPEAFATFSHNKTKREENTGRYLKFTKNSITDDLEILLVYGLVKDREPPKTF